MRCVDALDLKIKSFTIREKETKFSVLDLVEKKNLNLRLFDFGSRREPYRSYL